MFFPKTEIFENNLKSLIYSGFDIIHTNCSFLVLNLLFLFSHIYCTLYMHKQCVHINFDYLFRCNRELPTLCFGSKIITYFSQFGPSSPPLSLGHPLKKKVSVFFFLSNKALKGITKNISLKCFFVVNKSLY